ncbi:MAG: DUF1835 domain-containing protein [Geminicoccaceae bacterium]
MSELIITNGDSTVSLLRAAGFETEILPWRDVLHEGPVPETSVSHADDLEQLSAIRAAFLAEAFNEPLGTTVHGFEERDRLIRRHAGNSEVTLWFEHDLYDQLQLLQILAFFHREERSVPLQLVQADDYLGRQTPETIKRFEALKTPISTEQTALAAALFEAFGKPAPTDLFGFLDQDLSPLPHMRHALLRLFEELPSTRDGLSRTQQQALLLIESQGLPSKKLFGAVQASEDAVFMGDVSFFHCLDELAFNRSPLIQGLPAPFNMSRDDAERRHYLDADITLTDVGRAVLAGKADHAEINSIDRWLGGTHITGDGIWRWDRDAMKLVPPTRR